MVDPKILAIGGIVIAVLLLVGGDKLKALPGLLKRLVSKPSVDVPVEPEDELDERLHLVECLLEVRDYLSEKSKCCEVIDTCLIPSVMGASHDH